MIIHTADFGGAAKKFNVSRLWSEKVNKEFQAQYEEEGKFGYPQQPFMKDLDKVKLLGQTNEVKTDLVIEKMHYYLYAYSCGRVRKS